MISGFIRRIEDVSDGVATYFRFVPRHWWKVLGFVALIIVVGLIGWPVISLFKDKPQTVVQEQPPPDRWQVRYDQLYAQALSSFRPPPTNCILEIVTKNDRRYRGNLIALTTNAVVLDIDGRQFTYNRDWLSPNTREKILAPDYADSVARSMVEAEKAKAEKARIERLDQERLLAERADAERKAQAKRKADIERKKVQAERADAERKAEAERYKASASEQNNNRLSSQGAESTAESKADRSKGKHYVLLKTYENLKPIIDTLTNIRASMAVGISFEEFNRLQRVLAGTIIYAESDIRLLQSAKDGFVLRILTVQMMCKGMTVVWKQVIEQTDYPERGLYPLTAQYYLEMNIFTIFPKTENAAENGSLEDLSETIGVMRDDICDEIKEVTDEFNRRLIVFAQ